MCCLIDADELTSIDPARFIDQALRENHETKLFGAREVSCLAVPIASGSNSVKALAEQEVHDRREHSLAEVHALRRE